MGQGFEQIKKKRLISAIVKATICAVSCALFAVGIVLLPLKFMGVNMNAGYYVLIAVAAAVIFGGIVFVLLRPTDKRLAKDLDTRYNLDEKVQTALAFANENGAIIQLQREDADSRLQSIPQPKLNFANSWQYFVIAVICLALFFTAVFVPADSAAGSGDPPVYDPPFELTEFDEEAVRELIENVNSTSLDEQLRSAVVDILNTLLDDLADATVESQKIEMVSTAMRDIDGLMRGSLSYLQLSVDVASAGVIEIAWINSKGIKVYRDYLLREYEDVQQFAADSVDVVTDATVEWFDALEARIGEEKAVVASNLYLALLGTKVQPSNNMYVALNQLSHALSDENYNEQAFVKFGYDLIDEIAAQSYTLAVNRFVIDKLALIFGVNAIDTADYAPGETTAPPDDGDDNHQSQGGFGEGDVLYGSDDLVYDPDTGEYVQYGQLLNKLYAMVQERLRSGQLTEEQAKAITAYFEILFSGIKEG